MLFGFLRVVELVDLHELLQTLPEVEGEEVEPHQAARIQDQLQGIELDVQVGTRDWRRRGDMEGGGNKALEKITEGVCLCIFNLLNNLVLTAHSSTP